MSNSVETQIKEHIASFVRELDVLVRRNTLETLRSVLDSTGAPARRTAGRARGQGGNIAAAIVSHLRENDGQTVSQIAAAVGAAPRVTKRALVQLMASGEISKTGLKRGTHYHAGSRAPAW